MTNTPPKPAPTAMKAAEVIIVNAYNDILDIERESDGTTIGSKAALDIYAVLRKAVIDTTTNLSGKEKALREAIVALEVTHAYTDRGSREGCLNTPPPKIVSGDNHKCWWCRNCIEKVEKMQAAALAAARKELGDE